MRTQPSASVRRGAEGHHSQSQDEGLRLARPALAPRLLFVWILCLPLAGLLQARASPEGLAPFTATEAFALAHGVALATLGLASVVPPRLERALVRWARP
jgi:hypothetical protein